MAPNFEWRPTLNGDWPASLGGAPGIPRLETSPISWAGLQQAPPPRNRRSDERRDPDTHPRSRRPADQPVEIRPFRIADRADRRDGQVVSDSPRGAGGVPRRPAVLPVV